MLTSDLELKTIGPPEDKSRGSRQLE